MTWIQITCRSAPEYQERSLVSGGESRMGSGMDQMNDCKDGAQPRLEGPSLAWVSSEILMSVAAFDTESRTRGEELELWRRLCSPMWYTWWLQFTEEGLISLASCPADVAPGQRETPLQCSPACSHRALAGPGPSHRAGQVVSTDGCPVKGPRREEI